MKKNLHQNTSTFAFLACWFLFSFFQIQPARAQEVIANWNFAGTPGNQEFTTGTGVTGVAASNFTRGADLNPASSGSSFSSNGWNAGDARYFSFGFVVATGQKVDLTSLKLGSRSSNTGPRDMALQYSGDNFTTDLATWTSANTFLNQTIDLSALTNLEGTVEFRIISKSDVSANGGTVGSTGTFRVVNFFPDDTGVSFIGTVEAITGTNPSLSFDPTSIDFGVVNIGEGITDIAYTLTGNNLTEAVNITVLSPFTLSKDGIDFAPSIEFSTAELATEQSVSIRLDNSSVGTFSENITHQTSSLDFQLAVSASVIDPFNISENFNNSCPTGLPAGWVAFSNVGSQVWACTTFGRGESSPTASAAHGLQMNGFSGGGAQLNEDWLITPTFNLSNFDFPLLSFWSRVAFAGPRLRLLVSTDYVSGDPVASGANWVEITDRFATENVWTFSESINLSAYKATGVSIAFVYQSSAEEEAARWTLDDFKLLNSENPPAPYLTTSLGDIDYFHFGNVASGQVSELVKSFVFSLSDAVNPLIINAVGGFEFSKNNTDFTASLSYTIEEAAANNTVYIRFAPNSEGAFSGVISLESGSITVQKGFLTGATLDKEETFDVVSWNIEWFGSSSNDPSDDNLQLQNVKTVIEDLDADIYAFQEIVDLDKFKELVNALEGYKGFTSPAVSAGASFEEAQKLAFIYKTATVDSLSTQVLLQGVNPNDLVNYPSTTDRFWASGRLPYMFKVRVNTQGGDRELALINVHTRSNGGGESTTNPRYAMRRYDVEVLKDSLDAHFANMPLIILGDYNDDLDETVADQTAPTVNTSESSFIRYVEDSENYVPVTLNLSNAGLRTFITFENVIDHVIISDELEIDWLVSSERIVQPFDLVNNYESTTSDHLPVMVRFQLRPESVTALGESNNRLGSQVRIFPNPVQERMQVQIESHLNEQGQIYLYDMYGKAIYQQTVQLQAGQNNLEINLTDLDASTNVLILQVKTIKQGTSQTRILKY